MRGSSGSPKSSWTARLVGALSALLAALFVGSAAVGGALYWNRVEQRGEQAARTELGPLAAQQIPKVFGYDYQTVERTLNEVYPMLTPSYRQEFRDRAAKDIIPQARDRQLVSQAHVVGVGVLTAQRESGSVMVFLNRTVTDKSKEPVYDGSRLRVDYQKVDGKWLIQYITPI
ncbi:mammalian cell entry protein [Mycobacterium sp. E740]|uniref:mammalian cell entry protein n=1 Tax=Mycobacterium sp. E740 TaxID=1834149 RepID=UPI0007FEE427|nr:mammalian cell entry protein [Mycobacterium sp. E740]OBI70928.1 mammalian cell entry protein [Mycobacterium sp. E740]